MRILLVGDSAYTEYKSGAARSLRTLMQWLAGAGHECRVLCSARFDGQAPESVQSHLRELGIEYATSAPADSILRRLHRQFPEAGGKQVATFMLRGVAVTMVLGGTRGETGPNRAELAQLVLEFDRMASVFRPDLVVSQGPPPAQELMRRGHALGAATLYTVRNYGYEDRAFFQHADRVLMCSDYLSRYYRERIGIASTGIPSPIEWSDVLAPEETRTFVTFVNPALHKGAALFARLADMLGNHRPDIPVLIVQSVAEASMLNSVPGIEFSRHPQIMVSPALPRPADFLALTRILLVPSVFQEPFGRVAAEAMINGIPPLVSERGALPETVQEGGTVIPLPHWMKETGVELPDEKEARPWFDAIVELWDDPDLYAAAAARARAAAGRLYGEGELRDRYLKFFTGSVGNA